MKRMSLSKKHRNNTMTMKPVVSLPTGTFQAPARIAEMKMPMVISVKNAAPH